MTLKIFWDYITHLDVNRFPLIVKLEDNHQQFIDILYYNPTIDLYQFLSDRSSGYQNNYTQVIAFVPASDALARYFKDSYSES